MSQITTAVEEWRALPSCPLYEVSDVGRVRRDGRILKPQMTTPGYVMVSICTGDKKLHRGVHSLVAETFCGPPAGEVNHKDGNKTNNHADNLEWVSRSRNQLHAADIGLKPSGRDSHLCTKLKPIDVRTIRGLGVIGFTQRSIADLYGISQTYVGKIIRRTKWRQVKDGPVDWTAHAN